MKLFISWSGEFSQKVAETLSIWIPTIIQSVEVFFSPDDIAKGENWSNRLSEELDNCNFGIVCLTPENVAAPWIHFEAGALSKSLNTQVSAIMLNVSPSDVKGPLAYYQNTAFERNDFFRLFQSINKSSDTPLKPEILRNSFNNAWENLKNEIENIVKLYADNIKKPPTEDCGGSDNDALQEILRLVRKIDGTRAKISSGGTSDLVSISYGSTPDIDPLREVCVYVFLADPEDVLTIISRYIPTPKKRATTFQALKTTGKCFCSLPTSAIDDVKKRLMDIGAGMDADLLS